MQNVILTQLSVLELGQLFRNTLDSYFADKQITVAQPEPDKIGGIDLAVEITGKAKPTIYNLCSQRKLPHFKKSKQLLFSRNELTEWIKAGKRKTRHESALDAENFSNEKSRQPKN